MKKGEIFAKFSTELLKVDFENSVERNHEARRGSWKPREKGLRVNVVVSDPYKTNVCCKLFHILLNECMLFFT